MALWNRGTRLIERAETVAKETRAMSGDSLIDALEGLTRNVWWSVSDDLAMRVPAFRRANNLISGTVAQLPLVQWRNGEPVEDNPLLRQPEADRASWVTIQRLVSDIALYGKGYWMVRDVDPMGYPTKVRALEAEEVSEPEDKPNIVVWKGKEWPVSHPAGPGSAVGSVIIFEGFDEGVLVDGAQTIALAIALEEAAKRYADVPLPSIALKNTGADLTPKQVEALLAAWEEARANRATAYLSSVVDTETFGFSPAELTLTEARNFASLEIARLFNLDGFWIGANVSGSSLSYSNRVDLRKDLIDITLMDYMAPIEQRLSMRDVTPTITSNVVRFSTVDFLRNNLAERVAIVAQLVPLGVMTVEQATDFLRDSPSKGGPS
jgi:HK97 family phage portal protein